jgi:CelD/BcsL family acetyltransferase involved in cellulose biosynthesis
MVIVGNGRKERTMNERLITIKRVREIDDLEAIKLDWNALIEKNETKTVELTYEWQMTYWKYFNENAELFVLIVKEAGSILAIAPLKLTSIRVLGIKIRHLEFIAAGTSNYQDFIIGEKSEEVLECILDYLVSLQESWEIFSLRHIPETSTTAHFFLDKLNHYPLCRITGTEKCTFLKIDKSWADYRKSLEKDKHRMARRMRRIEREVGTINLRTSSTEDQFRSDLQELIKLHCKRWNQTDTQSQFIDSRYCRFYLEAGLQLFPKGQLNLFVLEAGETTLAQALCFTMDRCSVGQLIAYDPDYYKFSPVLVLLELYVEESLSNGMDTIDFGTYYPWKELWANHLKERVNLEIYPKRILPSIIYFLTRLYGELRTRLKRNPRILGLVKKLRSRIRLARINLSGMDRNRGPFIGK